jgi:hypothetical protein
MKAALCHKTLLLQTDEGAGIPCGEKSMAQYDFEEQRSVPADIRIIRYIALDLYNTPRHLHCLASSRPFRKENHSSPKSIFPAKGTLSPFSSEYVSMRRTLKIQDRFEITSAC